jgi:glycosyltransferase involved in cell wall biosynthesis
MAFGTPVIVWNEGAMPEIVDEGVTGFVVESVEEAVARVAAVERLDRARVRGVFERRFSANRMARDYEAVYRQLIGEPSGTRPAEARELL